MSSSSPYIVILVIAALFMVYLHMHKRKKYNILDLQKSVVDINKNISETIGSITIIIQSGNADPAILQFISDSKQQYKVNAEGINALDNILQQIQDAPQEFATIVDLKLEKLKNSGINRGYFSLDDTADQIATASNGIATSLVENNADYLFKSKKMTDYLKSYIDNSTGFKEVDSNITILQKKMDDAISQIDKLLTQLASGTLSIKWAVGKTVKCTGYTPKGERAVYRYDGSKLQWYPTEQIATTWDLNWPYAYTYDCTGVPLGSDMISLIPPNASVKCSVNNPKGAGAVYRYDNNKLRWFPTSTSAYSWDEQWGNAQIFDCTGIPFGIDMDIKYSPTPKLKNVSIDGNRICGIDTNGLVYCKDDLSSANWYKIPGLAYNISISGNNAYAVGTNNKLYYASDITSGNWTEKATPGNKLINTVDVDGSRVCVIPTDRTVWCKNDLTSDNWYNVPGTLDQISISGNSAYGVNTGNQPGGNGTIYYNSNIGSASSFWTPISGALKQVDISGNNVCGVNSNNNIYCKPNLTGSTWSPVPGTLSQISISGNNAYGVNPGNEVFSAPFNSGAWTKI